MVGALASSWGWYPEPGGGKVVWAELGTEPGTGEAAAGKIVGPGRLPGPPRAGDRGTTAPDQGV